MLLLDTGVSDFILFVGRFHPLIVHLPIGFLLLGGLFEWMSRKEKYKALEASTSMILLLGAISSVLAAIMGYFLSLGGGYNEDTLFWHQWMGILLSVIAIAAYLIKSKRIKVANISKAINGGLAISMVILLGLTGHLGGSLTHGSSYLTQYMPQPLRSIAGLPPRQKEERREITNLDSALVFQDVIHPMLKSRCISCHNEDKMKGELLMTSFDELMKGGENGVIIKAGNIEGSEILRRVHLPEEDEEYMPPEGKTPLSEEQISILEWWIAAGAPSDQLMGELEIGEDTRNHLMEELGLNPLSKEELLATSLSLPSDEVMDDIRSQGIKVYTIAQDNPFIEIDMSLSDTTVSAKQLESLLAAKEQILWVTMSGVELENEHLEIIGQLPNITKLKLDRTKVNDEGIKYLQQLESLEYLNLYGTDISDASLPALKNMKSLKRLYLWQTKVSQEAAQAVMDENPELEINLGLQLTQKSS